MDPKQRNNGFHPFFKKRGNAAHLAAFFVVAFSGVILFNVACAAEEQLCSHIFGVALLTLSLELSEVVRRLFLVIEEIQHKQTRYEGSWKRVLYSSFDFRNGGTIVVVGTVSFLVVSVALYLDCDTFCRAEYAIFFFVNCFVAPQLLFLVGLRDLSRVEVSQIMENEDKTVAAGLAWSYYFGYLKLVLPHLEEQIEKSDYKYQIVEKRLFILLPKNCYTYCSISDVDPRIKYAGNLYSYSFNRRGILQRSYEHPVHRIEMPCPGGEVAEYHVVVEYATPLMSLYNMSENPECGMSREERDEQVTFSLNPLILMSDS